MLLVRVALSAAATGIALGEGDTRGLGQFAKSAGLTLAVTHGLKYAVDAERPNGGDRSFPSGHTSIAFCSAEFVRRRYGLAYGAPAYVLASFVGCSRVEAEQHHIRDVVGGALIGIAGSMIFTRSSDEVSPAVELDPKGPAAAISYVW